MFYGKHNRQVWFLLFSYVKIWPYVFFPYILVKVAHLAAAEFQHLVIETLAVSVDKAVGEFVDAERLEGLFGQLYARGTEFDVAGAGKVHC